MPVRPHPSPPPRPGSSGRRRNWRGSSFGSPSERLSSAPGQPGMVQFRFSCLSVRLPPTSLRGMARGQHRKIFKLIFNEYNRVGHRVGKLKNTGLKNTGVYCGVFLVFFK